MTDEPALLAAIRANPDDDTPRLVYADWCQENDLDDRAAFIREQVAAYRAGDTTPVRNGIYRLVRGFAEGVECETALWLAHHATILALPFAAVRRVTLTTMPHPDWILSVLREAELMHLADPTRNALGVKWPGIEFRWPDPIAQAIAAAHLDGLAADAVEQEFEDADYDDYDDYDLGLHP